MGRRGRIAVWLLVVFAFAGVLLTGRVSAQAADDWVMAGAAEEEGGEFVLTRRFYSNKQAGGYVKTVPVDMNYGVRLDFDFWFGDAKPCSGEGFNVVFSNMPVGEGISPNDGFGCGYRPISASYYAVEISDVGQYMRALKNSPDIKGTELAKIERSFTQDKWMSLSLTAANGSLEVYVDGERMLSCSNFDVNAMSYVGIAAGAWLNSQTYKIRNVSFAGVDALPVVLDANGGELENTSSFAVPGGYASFPKPSRTGYTFDGWYTEKAGGEKVGTVKYNYTAGQTLYAHWVGNTYKVTLKTFSGTPAEQTIKVTFGQPYGKLPSVKPDSKKRVHTGWYYYPNYSADTVPVNSSTIVNVADDHTLYASFDTNWMVVKFKANKGKLSASKAQKKVEYGGSIDALPTPKRAGYIFLGWYTKASGGKRVETGTVINSNRTCYAQWIKKSKKVTIKLVKNGGTCKKSKLNLKAGDKLKGLPKIKKKGYVFLGWYTKPADGTKVTKSSKVAEAFPSKKLYAHWQKKDSGSGGSSGSSGGSQYNPYGGSSTGLGLNQGKKCIYCGGTGRKKCTTCGGSGTWSASGNTPYYSGVGGVGGSWSTLKRCTFCSGLGYRDCNFCGGDGMQ